MKKNLLFYVFRITVIITFCTGLIYLVKFFLLISQLPMMSTQDGFESLGSWSMIFFIYELLCLASLVLSAVTFKLTSVLSSAVRTAVMLFAAGADLFAHRYVSIFSSFDNAIDAVDRFQDIEDSGFGAILCSFAGVVLMLFAAITSVIALVRGSDK